MIKSNTLLDPIDSLQVVIEGDGRLDGFNIPAKNDAREINNKNGKVILVRLIASCIFSLSSEKPGAIRDTNAGINI